MSGDDFVFVLAYFVVFLFLLAMVVVGLIWWLESRKRRQMRRAIEDAARPAEESLRDTWKP